MREDEQKKVCESETQIPDESQGSDVWRNISIHVEFFRDKEFMLRYRLQSSSLRLANRMSESRLKPERDRTEDLEK